MSSALYQSIEALSREKSIDPGIVVSAVEEAIALATRKYYKTQENMRGELNKETGEINVYAYKTVMGAEDEIEDPVNQITLEEAQAMAQGAELEPGSEIRLYKDTRPLGRIAAQLAKQVIFQKVREAERDTVFNEYAHREKEVLSAAVKRIEGQDIIIDLGKAEARMPKREQSRLESFSVGERIRVVLLKVDRAAKGPQVVVSRAAPELVSNLFQSEVPEIYDNTVVIRAIAREAGERTKIAVMSRDKDVDPVGACVGMKGMRVQSIIRELRGEKIDIIEYNEEITTFAEKALQPAKVSRVSIVDLADKQLEVIVDDTQLSLAIGKKGQNVRLAAKLLGWKIDIKSEEEKRQEVEQQMTGFSGGPSTPIEAVTELGETIIQKLVAAGITTVESLADMTPEQLEEIPGIGEKTLERISVAVRHYFGQYEDGEANPNGADSAASAASPADEESSSAGAKAVEVDEPGTPDEPVEEATAELDSDSKETDADSETREVENAADAERTHPVEAEDVEPISTADLTGLSSEAETEAASEVTDESSAEEPAPAAKPKKAAKKKAAKAVEESGEESAETPEIETAE
ncbi:transcription termination factor NusA [Acidicapsa ligni]|uniref:transcription termination factor NusA n=1 Tax=Acidicapsa ligni TaxID=542300 RepID=UPI0021DFEB2B|nr:transcription termination factor NusA [Acidicapsa ligni]